MWESGMMITGGGIYDSEEKAAQAAIQHYYNSSYCLKAGSVPPKVGVHFGVYPSNSNPIVWIWEFPPRG
jgi:hypothetical protein